MGYIFCDFGNFITHDPNGEKIKTGQINWLHLVGGYRNSKLSIPYDENDPTYYSEYDTSIDELRLTAGCIEYIDVDEANISLIALTQNDLKSTYYKYDYC